MKATLSALFAVIALTSLGTSEAAAASANIKKTWKKTLAAFSESPAFHALSKKRRQEMATTLRKLVFHLGSAAGKRDLSAIAEGAHAPQGGADAEPGSVDLPGFVLGLLRGTFQAIVDSSIRQMDAYGSLLEKVGKDVSGFLQKYVSAERARSLLEILFPGSKKTSD